MISQLKPKCLTRVGQVWEDQVKRVFLVIGVSDYLVAKDVVYYDCLRLSAGTWSGTLTTLPEFQEIQWETIWTRLL